MVKKILQSEHKVLREVAKEVPITEINTPAIQKILKEMSASLKSQNDGVAIAAPQIGYSLRIFVVAGKIFSPEFADENRSTKDTIQTEDTKDLVFINPVITKLSRDKEWVPEGCLSVRPFYGKTYRSKKATVTAYDEQGKKFTRGGAGLLAQIFQHETDHLNGILFIDHAKDVKAEELPE
ncbi:MAG: peptide deformylase [Candidatus Paceibacteria bacterium]